MKGAMCMFLDCIGLFAVPFSMLFFFFSRLIPEM